MSEDELDSDEQEAALAYHNAMKAKNEHGICPEPEWRIRKDCGRRENDDCEP